MPGPHEKAAPGGAADGRCNMNIREAAQLASEMATGIYRASEREALTFIHPDKYLLLLHYSQYANKFYIVPAMEPDVV